MVPPQRCESEQYVEEIKSRESTRSKSHANMRSDRTTLCGATLGQVYSKSFQVPHHRQSEGAATQQRPGARTSMQRVDGIVAKAAGKVATDEHTFDQFVDEQAVRLEEGMHPSAETMVEFAAWLTRRRERVCLA